MAERVLVTGAAGGIGSAVCHRFLAAGAEVIGVDSNTEGLAALDHRVRTFDLDLTDSVRVDEAMGALEPLDVLIHCAGITSLGPFVDTPVAAFERVFDLNVAAAARVTKALLPGLIENKGRIGVLSSVSGFSPLLYRTAYAASKHALHGLFESLRAELADCGVSVTMICPSFVATGIEDRAAFRVEGRAGSWTTAGEVTTAADLADRIFRAVMGRKRILLPSQTARLAYLLSRVNPALYERAMRRRIGR